MEQIIIKNRQGQQIAKAPSAELFIKAANITSTFMSNDTLTIDCETNIASSFDVGSNVTIGGSMYRMNQLPQKKRDGSNGSMQYTMVFESTKYDLLNVRFLLPDTSKDDFITANLKELVTLVASNASRVYGTGTWIAGSVPDTDVVTKQFTEKNCLAALQDMMEAFVDVDNKKYEFRVGVQNGANVISVFEEDGGATASIVLSYGHKGGLYKIQRSASSTENIVTRLFVYGSSENIPTGYRHNRLCLPNSTRNQSYIESAQAIASYGVKEGFVTFDNIKPRALFKVSRTYAAGDIESDEIGFDITEVWKSRTEDGGTDYVEWLQRYGYQDSITTQNYYEMGGSVLTSLKVVGKSKYVCNGEVNVTFNTGRCAGMTFKVVDGSVSNNGKRFRLVVQEFNQDGPNPYQCPSYSGDPLHPSTYEIMEGDEFVISNIEVPMSIIESAESELMQEAQAELAYRRKKNARYSVEFDQIAKDRMDLNDVMPGNFVKINDQELGLTETDAIKITKVSKNLLTGDISMEISSIRTPKRVAGFTSRTDIGEYERIDVDGSRQTTLNCQFTPNYGSAQNKIHVGGGRFENYTLTGARRIWNIATEVVTIPTDHAYDVYVLANKKTSYASIIIRRDMTIDRDKVSAATSQNMPGVSIGTKSDACYYFRIGHITEPRFVHGSVKKYRTLTLEYGTTDVSSNDISVYNGTLPVDVGDRIVKDEANVSSINVNLQNIRNSVHGIIQSLQTARITLAGSDINVHYDWSTCDDTKCEPLDDPEELIPKYSELK